MLPLVLYDIRSKLPGNSWSPNPAKPRYERTAPVALCPFNEHFRFVLGYKNLPFETVWVEYADIASKVKEIGAPPNKRPDGSERYTVPVLSDPNTGAIITDSWVIAEYLDKTYPEKPIFPNGSKALISAFDSALDAARGDSFRFGLLRSSQILNERSRVYFIAARGADGIGGNVDEWSPEGPKRDAHWEITEKGFYNSAKKWYDLVEGKWLMGDTFSYADILLATRSFWYKKVYLEDEWKRIASLHDGKWEKLLAEVEKECNLA